MQRRAGRLTPDYAPPRPAAETPASLRATAGRKKLDDAVASADKAFMDAVTTARNSYAAALQQAFDAAMAAANLEDAKWAKAEIEQVKAGKAPTGEKPGIASVGTAHFRCTRGIEKAADDRQRWIDAARRQYILELEAAKRLAMSESKDLNEASRIADDIERARVMDFDPPTTTPSTPTQAPAERKPAKIDLLRLVDLDHDSVLSGSFRWEKNELIITEPKGARFNSIRLPYRPPAEYDFIIEFTILALRGPGDMNMLATSGDSSFGWYAGGGSNAGCSIIGFIDDRSRRNPTFTSHPSGVFKPGRRATMSVSVRRNSVSASLDGRVLANVETDFSSLKLYGDTAVGLGVLGLLTFNDAIVHRAEVVEFSGPGRVLRRLDARQMRGQAQAFRGLRIGKTLSLTELHPRATQVGWGEYMVNQSGERSPILVEQRVCTSDLYAHAPSSIIFNIPEGAIGFRSIATRPAGGFRADTGKWRVAVVVDDCEVFLSRNIQEMNGHIPVEIPLPKDARQIELRADPLGSFDYDVGRLASDSRAAASGHCRNGQSNHDNTRRLIHALRLPRRKRHVPTVGYGESIANPDAQIVIWAECSRTDFRELMLVNDSPTP